MATPRINRQWRLDDNQYFKEYTEKINICLHHTVGGSAESTFDYWQSNPDRIATAYIIERDGEIYEVFDPSYWAHHLGLKMPKNIEYNQRCIGIELASEGALRSGTELNILSGSNKFDPNYLYAFDIDPKKQLPKSQWFQHAKKLYHMYDDRDKFFDCPVLFRGYKFFDLYDIPQIESTIILVNYLCEQFSIPKRATNNLQFGSSILTSNWKGVYTHVNVREDKSDLSPAWDWHQLSY